MKRLILILLLSFFPLTVFSFDWAVTGGPVTYFPAGKHVPEGLYAQAGARFVLTPRIELELYASPQITPEPFSAVGFGVLAGFNLLEDIEPAYFHMIADAGVFFSYVSETQEMHPKIQVRLSPLSIGNPYYRYRGRLLTFGVLYDLKDQSVSFSFSMWIQNWFVSRH